MKALSVVLLLMASMAFVMVGCSENSSPIATTSSDQSLLRSGGAASPSLAKVGPLLNSVSGNVHAFNQFYSLKGGKRWDNFCNISLSAKLGQDDIPSGNIYVRYIGVEPPPGFFPPFAGRIIQLRFEENPGVGMMAKVMFEITKGAELFPPEWGFGPTPVGCFVVVDGGEGKNAPPDCQSTLWAIDNPGVMQTYGFYEMTPSDFLESTVPWLPPGLPVCTSVGNGNLQVR